MDSWTLREFVTLSSDLFVLFFLTPNTDCMECMACSDNVVRAGLTPKYKDVSTLCEMLTYKSTTAEERIFPCVTDSDDSNVSVYNPPVPDFGVRRIKVSDLALTAILNFKMAAKQNYLYIGL